MSARREPPRHATGRRSWLRGPRRGPRARARRPEARHRAPQGWPTTRLAFGSERAELPRTYAEAARAAVVWDGDYARRNATARRDQLIVQVHTLACCCPACLLETHAALPIVRATRP